MTPPLQWCHTRDIFENWSDRSLELRTLRCLKTARCACMRFDFWLVRRNCLMLSDCFSLHWLHCFLNKRYLQRSTFARKSKATVIAASAPPCAAQSSLMSITYRPRVDLTLGTTPSVSTFVLSSISRWDTQVIPFIFEWTKKWPDSSTPMHPSNSITKLCIKLQEVHLAKQVA